MDNQEVIEYYHNDKNSINRYFLIKQIATKLKEGNE